MRVHYTLATPRERQDQPVLCSWFTANASRPDLLSDITDPAGGGPVTLNSYSVYQIDMGWTESGSVTAIPLTGDGEVSSPTA